VVPTAPTTALGVNTYTDANGLVQAVATAKRGWADIVSYRFDFGDGTTSTPAYDFADTPTWPTARTR
jgi:hypothetical protein